MALTSVIVLWGGGSKHDDSAANAFDLGTSFFDAGPSSTVLNRFTGDVREAALQNEARIVG